MQESVETIWRNFTERHKGTFTVETDKIFSSEFSKPSGHFILSTYRKGIRAKYSMRTKISCTLNHSPKLQFKIRHQGLFNKPLILLGMQDIQIGDQYFDDNFVIQGSPVELLQEFLQQEQVRHLLPKSYELVFELKNNVLEFRCRGFIKENGILESLVALIEKSVTQLQLVKALP